jgi:probable F420-dependent oxidoreductase
MFDKLGKIGVWRSAAQLSPEVAATLERLGYGAIWIGGSPSGDLRLAEQLLDATTTLTVATGIVNIWKDKAEPVAASYHRIEARHPGRFLLGIGVGHPEAIGARYAKPYEALVGYLDELDAAQVPIGRRVLAALGPKMLKLSAERAAGAHPYLTTPEHIRKARAILGSGVFLAPRLRPAGDIADPEHATKTALRRLARRHQYLSEVISAADTELRTLVTAAAPRLIAPPGVGTEVAGQILITAGDNPDRLRSEAAFAHLCGVAPIPASSGRTHRHRLNRGGDHRANNALYLVVLGRLRYDSRTRAYAARRTTEGLSKAEIIRCLKRYVAREIFTVLTARAAGDQSHTAQTMSTAA